ncbi:hypothetical protein H2508_13190 [Parahaliea sp. F7430]|uniref:Glycosyltransferase RgtA/B/C/D-like domain-containing protein n=1 Tax=Sediminihaliea albiluteola TaxID=2758564 RepID=A0A7W2YKF2_9GAMM|nr:hypothetical protein [Sediminihaliea albiluteola]MBA6414067.1 hypothetical protein [Sediminihaliea albiluteola]
MPSVYPLVALLLPWLIGSLLMARLLASSKANNCYLTLGHGYFLGVFLVTAILRLLDGLNWSVDFYTVVAFLVALGGAALIPLQKSFNDKSEVNTTVKVSGGEKAIIVILIGLIALRYGTILIEVLERPLYPWDAWMNWAPKAVVWFHNGEISTFVSPSSWLNISNEIVYTLGNYSSSTYPESVPLLYWWMMMAGQSDSSPAILVPWVLAPIALGFSLYGYLRVKGVGPFLAVVAVYMLVNTPFVNVHSALAGYADIWMAAVFSLALFSLGAFEDTGEVRWLVLCIMWCIVCGTVKKPGIVLGLIVIAGLARAVFKPRLLKELTVVAFSFSAFLVALILGVKFVVPSLGTFQLDLSTISVSKIGAIRLGFDDVGEAAIATLFGMLNWNITFYLVVVVMVFAAILMRDLRPNNAQLVVGFVVLFLAFIYSFTHYSLQLKDYTTFNRTVLYVLPSIIYLLSITVHGLLIRLSDRQIK